MPSIPDDEATGIAIAALSHFATDTEVLSRFLSLTGLNPSDIRQAATSPAFTAAVLDFVLSDDALAIAVAEAQEIAPERIGVVRQRLARRDQAEDTWPPQTNADWA